MRKTHVAFINVPLPPHVNPTLPVVSVMIRRGYRVTYVTSDRFASQVAKIGAEVIPCSRAVVFPTGGEGQSTEDWQPFTITLANRMLAEIVPFYEGDRPDVVLYDFMAFAGHILAHRLNLRAIQTSPDLPEDERNENRLVKMFEFPEYNALVSDYFKRHGIADHHLPFYERLNILFVPRTFQPPGEDRFGPDFFYAGRCAGEQDPYGDWCLSNTDERPIVVLGTSTTYTQAANYFTMCIDALRDLNCRIVIYAGDKLNPEALSSLPSECEVVRGCAQVRLFRDAHLLVCHGGLITPAEAAYYGVPLLMMTHGVKELETWADVVALSGLGIHLRERDTNVENIRHRAQLLLTDPSLKMKVKKVRDSVRREAGAEETVNRIEEYLES